MNETIIQFLQEQTCANICCVDETGKPYCFSCFYAFNCTGALLYFKSSATSHHADLMKKNPLVAGTILPDKLNKISIKGIQFEATVLNTQQPLVKRTLGIYLAKHPLALAIPGDIWALQINYIKMTDSTLGFGKKIIWKREEEDLHFDLPVPENIISVK
jgi:uncharacterized protein YhbP (UPF0306 family)